MTLADEKKGITVKIDADLHAEVREYIEQHGMTMAEFITLAVDNELHPKYQNKEEKNIPYGTASTGHIQLALYLSISRRIL